MKRVMYFMFMFMLVFCMFGVASGAVVRVEAVYGRDFARLRYDGFSVDYGPAGDHLMIGDHIHGANHYSDGVVKFDIPDVIQSDNQINSVTYEGYHHVHGSWDGGSLYMKIQKFTYDNGLPESPTDANTITWADSPEDPCNIMEDVAVFKFFDANYYSFDVTAAVAADIAAGFDYTSWTWQASDPNGMVLQNGAEYVPANYPEVSAIYMIGFTCWEWAPNLDKPALVIDYGFAPDNCTQVLEGGYALTSDLAPNQDCAVDALDFSTIADKWGTCTFPAGAGCIVGDLFEPVPIIVRGSCVVDADLSEWGPADQWIPIDKNIYLNPDDVSEAKVAYRWSEDTNKIYAAVIVTDTTHIFTDSYVFWDASDRADIYSQGDAAGGTYVSTISDSAQQYFCGSKLAADGSLWESWPGGWPLNSSVGFESAVAIDGDNIIYEFGVQMYDNYAGNSGSSGSTIISDLEVDKLVRFDVTIDTRWGSGANEMGMLATSETTNRSGNADSITVYKLVDSPCGSWGYVDADLSRDCFVDLNDLSLFLQEWLVCNDPEDESCIENW